MTAITFLIRGKKQKPLFSEDHSSDAAPQTLRGLLTFFERNCPKKLSLDAATPPELRGACEGCDRPLCTDDDLIAFYFEAKETAMLLSPPTVTLVLPAKAAKAKTPRVVAQKVVSGISSSVEFTKRQSGRLNSVVSPRPRSGSEEGGGRFSLFHLPEFNSLLRTGIYSKQYIQTQIKEVVHSLTHSIAGGFVFDRL